LYGAVGGLLVAFILFYGGPGRRTGHRGYVATVSGQEIPLEGFRVIRRTQSEQEQRLRDMGMKSKGDQQNMEDHTMEFLIQRALLAKRSSDLGFTVSREELRAEVCDNPYVKDDKGNCDRKKVDRWRAAQGFETERSYVDMLSREILVRKLVDFFDE